MNEYEQNLYSEYHSHTKNLYGDKTIEKIKSQFPIYKYYFGKFLPSDKDSKIIDLGCGSGDFVYWLTNLGYKHVEGIDLSQELIKIGNNLGIQNIYANDIYDFLSENKKSFNIIIMRDVLEHFNKDATYNLVKLLYDNLSENGSIILQVPNGQSPFVGKILFGDFTHHNAFTDKSLNQLFNSVGFRQIKVFEVTPVSKNFKGLIRLWLWKCVRIYFQFLQGIATGYSEGFFSPNLIAVITK